MTSTKPRCGIGFARTLPRKTGTVLGASETSSMIFLNRLHGCSMSLAVLHRLKRLGVLSLTHTVRYVSLGTTPFDMTEDALARVNALSVARRLRKRGTRGQRRRRVISKSEVDILPSSISHWILSQSA